MHKKTLAIASAAGAVLFTQSLLAVPVTVIAKDGDAPPGGGGSTITALNTAYVAGNGKVGFVTTLSDGSRGIWFDTGIIFKSNSIVSPVLSGAEGTMGVSDAGGFAYSPSIDGEDGVWSHIGKLVRGTEAAPGQPALFTSFGSRPRMKADGTAYWVGGTSTTAGGATSVRALYKATTAGGPPGVISRLLTGGDTVAGATITAQGIEFPFDVSDNNAHYTSRLTFTGPVATDTGVVLDGTTMIAREGDPIGGSTWQNFRFNGVNNAGNWLVYGDDASAADDIVVYNGSVITRQGTVVDGVTLGATVDAAAINNLNQMIQIWDTTGASLETLFFSSNAANPLSAVRLLGLGDPLDVNGDNVADFTLTDFNASATITDPIDFGDDGRIFIDVDMTPVAGGAAVQAIIQLNVPEPGMLSLLSIGALGLIRRRR